MSTNYFHVHIMGSTGSFKHIPRVPTSKQQVKHERSPMTFKEVNLALLACVRTPYDGTPFQTHFPYSVVGPERCQQNKRLHPGSHEPLTVSRRSGSASQSKNKSDGLVMSMTFYDYDL